MGDAGRESSLLDRADCCHMIVPVLLCCTFYNPDSLLIYIHNNNKSEQDKMHTYVFYTIGASGKYFKPKQNDHWLPDCFKKCPNSHIIQTESKIR